jgi:subtilase-type serine protease
MSSRSKFGNVCFFDDCFDLSTLSVPITPGTLNNIRIPGGPGSTNFVPNNVVANPSAGVRARYYEVTLNALGKTSLANNITIDRLNLSGLATLDVKRAGTLKVWGDYTQTGGWLNVDGSLATGEAFIGNGLLTGSGRFDPTYLTSVRGIIAPGSIDGAGTLTIAGDVILSSASLTFFDVGRRGNDTLTVVADADNAGIISLGGTAAVINPIGRDSARFGQTFTIITAQGGVQNQFDDVARRCRQSRANQRRELAHRVGHGVRTQ